MAENSADDEAITLIIADELYIAPSSNADGISYIHWTKDITSGIKSLTEEQMTEVCGSITHAFVKYRGETVKDKLIPRLIAILGEKGDDESIDGNDILCERDIYFENVETTIVEINSRYNRNHIPMDCKILKMENRLAMFLVVDNRIDPNRNLRQWLLESKDCGQTLHDEDTFTIKNSDLDRRRITEAICVKKCYYPMQKSAATIVLKRLTFILKEYHDKTLDDFSDFDFRIYTANSLMLEEQTKKRLGEKEAECFDPKTYETNRSIRQVVDSSVFKYVTDKNSKDDCIQLKKEAKDNPKKLFLIVADEAHWGVTAGVNCGNKVFVNDWSDVDYPNVFVLQVTATPWTLLTENSKLDREKYVAEDVNGNLVGVEEKRNHRLYESVSQTDESGMKTVKEIDVTDLVGPKKPLHIIGWTETYEHRLRDGLLVCIRVPQTENTDPCWLMVGNQSFKIASLHHWMGVNSRESATLVMIRGTRGTVTIICDYGQMKERLMLVVAELEVGFVNDNTLLKLKKKDKTCDKFTIVMNYNENLIELEPYSKQQQLQFNEKDNRVVSVRKAADVTDVNDIPGCSYHEKNYMFIFESQESGRTGKEHGQYLSLNLLCNSMRNKNISERLIRGDETFQTMISSTDCKNRFHVPGHVLAAEYGYYIVLLNSMESFDITKKSLGTQLATKILDYVKQRNLKVSELCKTLKSSEVFLKDKKSIPSETFWWTIEYIENNAWKKFEKWLIKPNNKFDEFMDLFVNYILNANEKRYTEILGRIKNAIDSVNFKISGNQSDMFTAHKIKVLCKSETYKIVKGLSDSASTINGQLNIVRLANIIVANQFYVTIVMARHIGCIQNEYKFEIIRYYDKLQLSSEKQNTAVHRIWQKLQRTKCSHVEKITLFSCKCVQYIPNENEIKCSNCKHRHTEIKQFSDLNKLPCIVIVVEKGRMGDTYPPSFNAMDLRVRQLESAPTLNALVQELGRLCRYQTNDYATKLPYALVGPEALNCSTRKLNRCAVAVNLLYNGAVDGYTTKKRGSKKMKKVTEAKDEDNETAVLNASNNHFNAGNTGKHCNRLLFSAEPQIGKTGVYLRTICLLRRKIKKEKSRPKQSVEKLDSDEEEGIELTESDNSDEDNSTAKLHLKNQSLSEAEWKYPYWKHMLYSKKLKNKLNNSKYCRIYGQYKHNVSPEFSMTNLMDTVKLIKINENLTPEIQADNLHALNYSNNHCSTCSICNPPNKDNPLNVSVLNANLSSFEFRLSVPNQERFSPLRKKLFSKKLIVDHSEQPNIIENKNTLKTWIFNPSYKRAKSATINYGHTMFQQKSRLGEEQPLCNYVQILVVRQSDFDAYSEGWKLTHAILELPDSMPDCDVDINEGRIGYSRLFIQRFCEFLEIDKIFVIDDNVYAMYDRNFKLDRSPEFHQVSFFDALRHLEYQFQCGPSPNDNDFEEYSSCNQHNKVLCCKNTLCRESNTSTIIGVNHEYTGPGSIYGVLGVQRDRGKYHSTKPFSRTHCFSLVMLNIAALKSQSIRYRPWPAHEDCQLNNDCDTLDTNGQPKLIVCKYNRFLMRKKHLLTYIPLMYLWTNKTVLSDSTKCELQSSSYADKRILRWIREMVPPNQLSWTILIENETFLLQTEFISSENLQNRNMAEENSTIERVLTSLRSRRTGKHYIMAITPSGPLSSRSLALFASSLAQFYKQDVGHGGYDQHVILLPASLCHHLQIVNISKIQETIVRPVFGNCDFQVLTSHNVDHFKIDTVILYIHGKGKN